MAKRVKLAESDFPEPGSVFMAPTGDGRLAAGRILRRQFEGGAFAVLIAASRWLGTQAPDLGAAELREPLVLTHHNWKGQPEIFWAQDAMPADFTILGRIALTEEDLAASSNTFGGWHSVPFQALTQWRWDHDREALLQEEAAQAQAENERRQKVAAARAEMLRTLTLDSLAESTWLESWESEVPATSLHESRTLLARLVEDLRSQPTLTKPSVKKLFKQTVQAFNRLDSRSPFIATIEREDLCEAFERIACAAGQPLLADDVDRWRTW